MGEAETENEARAARAMTADLNILGIMCVLLCCRVDRESWADVGKLSLMDEDV